MTDKTTAHTLGGLENNALSPGLEQTSGDVTSQGSEGAETVITLPRVPTVAMLQGACDKHTPGKPMLAPDHPRYQGDDECPRFQARRKIYARMIEAFEAEAARAEQNPHDLPPSLSPETAA